MWSAGLVSVFWALANGLELELAERWYGRSCCQRARLEGCRRACLQARSADDLEPWCRRSDELDLQVCLEGRSGLGALERPGRRGLESCCSLAGTAACRRRACNRAQSEEQQQQLKRENDNGNRELRRLQQHRQEEGQPCAEPQVVRCLRNVTSTKQPNKLHCCSQAPSGQCRDACLRVLRPKEAAVDEPTPEEDAVDALLAGGCAAPGLHAYGSEWETSWETFHGRCRYQPAEAALRQCLDDVDEPCELGCGGPLSFCADMGGRPWSLYRRCDASADRVAWESARLWKRTGPPTAAPLGSGGGATRETATTVLGDCPADAWRMLACTLNLRPCHATHHSSTLCRADCLALAARCKDGRQLAPLCDSLAPPGAPCYSILGLETQPTTKPPASESATQPCRSRPCGSSSICVVNRHCAPGQSCSMYRCLKSCPVGSASGTLVPQGSPARLPRVEGGRLCWTRCRCSESGVLTDCVPTGCDDATPRKCWLAARSHLPGSRFLVHGCLRCRCESTGHISCTRAANDCLVQDAACGCGPEDEEGGEVCGADGRTHRSACLARCAGLAQGQWEPGRCHQTDPCAGRPCSARAPVCVARRRACLGPCRQFICIANATDGASGEDCRGSGPVCDTEGREHPSLCGLLSSRDGDPRSRLAHHGPCEQGCRARGPVCGLDGETYASECSAWAQRVLVDYRGPCLHRQGTEGCNQVRCPLLPPGGCQAQLTRLPGTCCPLCGWGLRLVMGRHWRDGDSDQKEERPLSELLWWLRTQLSSTQCDLFGHLDPALPDFLVVLVVPTSRPASWTLCRAEAQRLDAMVRVRSPALFSLLPMEAVAGSAGLLDEMPQPTSSAPGAGRLLTHAPLLTLLLLPLLLVTVVCPAPLLGPLLAAAATAVFQRQPQAPALLTISLEGSVGYRRTLIEKVR
ncbi:reversion-inducing cysteine-rich protein with Kazal motifs isoform X3 [Dermacentor albipictus]|uniref:reversion-inducing cysteine-rich protein with Kazal motifs isoform X3 n=1 Tax=Dermacentor albipictus TaxID=60249 RepID=UPI0031FC34E9